MAVEQDDIETVGVVGLDADDGAIDVDALSPILGRYEPIETLGMGGMGVVYRAYDPELDRDVAIKKIRRVGDLVSQRRLIREARAMAQLSHPNVVPVYDVGGDEDHVFIAMECVRGETLGTVLAGRPGWREVLRLFLAAGEGLVAAHECGLVHRDFKPANVLVGEDGRARVTDFGLARPLGSFASAPSGSRGGARRPDPASRGVSELSQPVTEAGALVGTPAYMAPEQHHGKPADARSDQFSFCVALFEGLFVRRPFEGKTAEAYLVNKELGSIRGVGVNAVPRRISAAVRRGLQREPGERWPSLRALLDELAQANRPERRRWVLGLGLTGVSLLVGGVALRAEPEPCVGAQASLAATWNDGRRVAVAAAFKATELGYADTTWRHAELSLDAAAAVYIVEHREACLATRDKVDEKAQRRLDERLRCLADWRARVDTTLSGWERADSVAVEHAVAGAANLPDAARCSEPRYLDAAQLPPGDPALARRVAAVRDKIRLAEAEFWAGHPKAARQYAEPALADAEGSGYPPVIAEALYTFGHALDLGGDYDRAFVTFERAYLAAKAIGHDEVAATAAIEAAYLAGFRRADYVASDSWLAHARAAVARYGGDPRLALYVLECEGSLAVRRGQYQEAIALLSQAVEDRVSYAGVSELGRAEVLGTLGNAYRAAGRHVEALAALEEVARIRRAATPGLPQTANAMNNVANVLMKLGRYDEAFEILTQVLAVFRRAHGEEHADVSMALSNIGATELKRGNIKAATDALTRAIEIRKLTLGPRHPEVGVSLLNLGSAYGQLLQTEKAERVSQEALGIFLEAHGPEHPYVAAALTNIAVLQQSMGKLDDALATLDDVEGRMTAKVGTMHEDVAKIVTLRGSVLLKKGDLAAARLLFGRALKIYETALGAGHPDLAYPVVKLGDCARQEEDLGLADRHYRRAIQLMREANVSSPLLAEVRFKLARVLGHDNPEAIELANKAREYLVSQSAEELEELDAWLEASRL